MNTLWILPILWLRLPKDVRTNVSDVFMVLSKIQSSKLDWDPSDKLERSISVIQVSDSKQLMIFNVMPQLNKSFLRVYLIFLYKVKYNDLRVLNTVFMEINRNSSIIIYNIR